MGTSADVFLFKNKKQFKKWKKTGSELYLTKELTHNIGCTISSFLSQNGFETKPDDIDTIVYTPQLDDLLKLAKKGFKDNSLIDAEYILNVFTDIKREFNKTGATLVYFGLKPIID